MGWKRRGERKIKRVGERWRVRERERGCNKRFGEEGRVQGDVG